LIHTVHWCKPSCRFSARELEDESRKDRQQPEVLKEGNCSAIKHRKPNAKVSSQETFNSRIETKCSASQEAGFYKWSRCEEASKVVAAHRLCSVSACTFWILFQSQFPNLQFACSMYSCKHKKLRRCAQRTVSANSGTGPVKEKELPKPAPQSNLGWLREPWPPETVRTRFIVHVCNVTQYSTYKVIYYMMAFAPTIILDIKSDIQGTLYMESLSRTT
jgi:hypothetical protein